MTPKVILRTALQNVLRGRFEGLSHFGQLTKRVAQHLEFQIASLQRQAFFRCHTPARSEGWLDNIPSWIIYDFGANRGLNFPYYFSRGFKVVAVEENPLLCIYLQREFHAEVESGKLKVINRCLSPVGTMGPKSFYISKNSDVLSSAIKSIVNPEQFEEVVVMSELASNIMQENGLPFYVKIDVEGMDVEILSDIFQHNVDIIPYISAEAHSIQSLIKLNNAGYTEFKVVEGQFVDSEFYSVSNADGAPYRFPSHSAGPFGEDIPGEWMTCDQVFQYFAKYGTGWKDLHARMRSLP